MPERENMSHPAYRILIVDDQGSTVEFLKRLFSSSGFLTLEAYNGLEALQVARSEQPDLILLDVMMPKMNGYQVLQELRKDARTTSIPVIFLTGIDNPSDMELGLGLGADDFLTKPVDIRILVARAKNKIELSRVRRDLTRRTRDLEALLRVSERLNANLDAEELLQMITFVATDLIPNQACFALTYTEGNTDRLFSLQTFSPELMQGILHEINQATAIQDTALWETKTALPYPYCMVSSLRYADELLGYIFLANDEPFDVEDGRLIEGISRQATLALRNAELMALKSTYAQELQTTVTQRTQQVKDTYDLLIRSERLAAVGRFAAVMSHEIKNPLNSIGLLIESALEDAADGLVVNPEDLQVALKSAQRVREFVERLLQFTRQGSSEAISMAYFSLSEALRNVLALAQPLYKDRKQQIETLFEVDKLPMIFGNITNIEQVFLNIIVNARDAMQSGGKLSIAVEVFDDAIEIYFSDVGSGIPEAVLNTIFEPSATTKSEGTGLGLFISYEIIRNHNGEIRVESQVGKGTRFTVRLPIAYED